MDTNPSKCLRVSISEASNNIIVIGVHCFFLLIENNRDKLTFRQNKRSI
nr:MAG TPA: hypothetical protein [Caudoviricetes sp.]